MLEWLWAGYLLAIPFHRVWVLPWFGIKLQPPDVIFVGCLVFAAATWRTRSRRVRFHVLDLAAALWCVSNVLAFAWSGQPRSHDGLIEVIGAAYLTTLYVAVRLTATGAVLDRWADWLGYSAAIAAALAIGGSLAASADIASSLATTRLTPVPYLGPVPRAQALTAGPQMLASILVMAVPLIVARRMQAGWRRRDILQLSLILAGLVATFSKTALCLPAALAVLWAWDRPSRRWYAVTVWVLTAVVFTIASHLMVVRQSDVSLMQQSQLVSGDPIFTFDWRRERWAVMPTTYVFNNAASLEAMRQSWPRGIGPAGQPAFALALQAAGRFPSSQFLVTPHSTYFGIAAQLGAIGTIALALLVGGAGLTIVRLASTRCPPSTSGAYAAVGAAFLIEGISTDLMNCRHYWFLLGVIAASARRYAVDTHAIGENNHHLP